MEEIYSNYILLRLKLQAKKRNLMGYLKKEETIGAGNLILKYYTLSER
jgi:hypothetical protein